MNPVTPFYLFQWLCIAGWIPAAIGFLLGGLFLRFSDAFLPHLHIGHSKEAAEGVKTQWR